jgi:hypothetical protein
MCTNFQTIHPTPEHEQLISEVLAQLNRTPEFVERVTNTLAGNPLDRFVVTCVSPKDKQIFISCLSGISDEEEAAADALLESGFSGTPDGTFMLALATGTCQKPGCLCGERSTYILPVLAFQH